MDKVRYGNTTLMVSRLCFGTGLMAKNRYHQTPEEGAALLRYAYDLGVTFWDTADSYESHPHVREALRGLDRSTVVVNTKVRSKTRDEASADIDRFLRELGTDYVDSVLLHGVMTVEELQLRQGALEALLEAKAQGKVRAVGLSTHIATGPIMDEVARRPEIEVCLTLGNKDGVMLIKGTIEEHLAAIERVYRAGKAICLMKVLADGALAARAADAIRWALAFPYAHSATIGFRDADQVTYAVRIANGEPIEPELAARATTGR